MRIRPMELHDVPACAGILMGHELWNRYGVTHERAERMFKEVLADGGADDANRGAGNRLDVCEDGRIGVGGTILGFSWVMTLGAFGRSDYLRLLAVKSGHTGRGVGRALFEEVVARSHGEGRDLFLMVSTENTDAQRFYERCGCVMIGKIPSYVLPGVDEYLLRHPA